MICFGYERMVGCNSEQAPHSTMVENGPPFESDRFLSHHALIHRGRGAGCGGTIRNQQDEQDEDDEEHNRPAGVTAKHSVHHYTPSLNSGVVYEGLDCPASDSRPCQIRLALA